LRIASAWGATWRAWSRCGAVTFNDSYVVTRRSDGRRYLVQRINQTVFAHPEAV
jgi:hypothetical protein